MNYKTLSKKQLVAEKANLEIQFNQFKKMNLSLDMSRGKPNSQQLDITAKVFKNIDCYSKRVYEDNFDLGNYGLLEGTKAAKTLFSQLLEIEVDNLIIGGNSSLNLMYDMFSHLMLFGNQDSNRAWGKENKIKFLCPVPGYDRHLAICEQFGVEMITVNMSNEGPDMDYIESLVKDDESIKGMWCVPKYSNPDGYTYSFETIDRLAKMNTKAKDFRIFWDNAYVVHNLYDDKQDEIANILNLCNKYNNENRVYIFASTSKISLPGSGIAAIGASKGNIENIISRMKIQTIGYDKINMLRHTLAFKNKQDIVNHMKKLAAVIRPKFEIVLNTLEEEIQPLQIATWNKPLGGYFVSFYSKKGCAKKIVYMCNQLGVKLTGAGATYPYHKDPDDSNIRIAPTYPDNNDLQQAIDVFVLCVKIATIEKILEEN